MGDLLKLCGIRRKVQKRSGRCAIPIPFGEDLSSTSVYRAKNDSFELSGAREKVRQTCRRCLVSFREDSSCTSDHLTYSFPAIQQVKTVLIGSSGVGKTSLVKQFVENEFSETYLTTRGRISYYPSVVVDDHLYHLIVSDLPQVRSYPQNCLEEWNSYRDFGLRSAVVVIFVFDLTRADSFTHIKMLRDQLAESRDIRELGILVVGNKRDLVPQDGKETKWYADSVKKCWRAPYLEASAKYNWHVVATFKEVLLNFERSRRRKNTWHSNLQELGKATGILKCTTL